MLKNVLAITAHVSRRPSDAISDPQALSALAALGQPTRLEIFRLLMRHEPEGLPAGVIAGELGCPHNSLSTHLAILVRAGLVQGTRSGRSIIYRADVSGVRRMISYLVTDCCDGHPDLCNFASATGKSFCARGLAPKATRRRSNR